MQRFLALILWSAAAMAGEPTSLTALPAPLETRNPPVVWTATGPDALTIQAGPKTNWFVPPWNGGRVDDNAPTLLFRPQGDFSLTAKVSLQPKARWDSGALTLFVDKDNWAKLCFENAQNDGKLQVVMVVNRGLSDDSYTDRTEPGNALFLRISRKGTAFFFAASKDGKEWTMYRAFALNGDLSNLRAGLLAQSPVGDGITVTFSDIRYEPAR